MSTRLVVSIGCPAGIGPEVSLRAAAAAKVSPLLVGDLRGLQWVAKRVGVAPERLVRVERPGERVRRGTIHVLQPTPDLAAADRKPGEPTSMSGAAQLAWIDTALELVRTGVGRALVTGPVNKAIIAAQAEPSFRGHTEYLKARLGAKEVVMAFVGGGLATALVTTHLPLSKVPGAINKLNVASAAYWLAQLILRLRGTKAKPGKPRPTPTLAVAALNPHAGEGGLLGDEEQTIRAGIVYAQASLRRHRIGVLLAGPVPAETAFRLAKDGTFAGVVAMYHDQATIPMKLLSFGEAVNVSLGLPIVRTSVDHGTGYDRAGKGVADASGMTAALTLADRLT